MKTDKTTGKCARCGGVATVVRYSRSALQPLELCGQHFEEHKDAIAKGEWTEEPYTRKSDVV